LPLNLDLSTASAVVDEPQLAGRLIFRSMLGKLRIKSSTELLKSSSRVWIAPHHTYTANYYVWQHAARRESNTWHRRYLAKTPPVTSLVYCCCRSYDASPPQK